MADESVILDPVIAAEQRILRQAVEMAMRSVIGAIRAEAAKFTDRRERDYQAGMQHAAFMIERAIEERK